MQAHPGARQIVLDFGVDWSNFIPAHRMEKGGTLIMKAGFVFPRFMVVVLLAGACGSLSCCLTASLVAGKRHYLGSARQINSCQEAGGRAYVTWRAEHGGGLQVTALDLRTRQTDQAGVVPAQVRSVPLVVLEDENSSLPAGRSRPCLGIWKVHPGVAGSLWVPRVRWFGPEGSFVVNLPCYGNAVPSAGGKLARLPATVVKDGFLGFFFPLFLVGGPTAAESVAAGCGQSAGQDPWQAEPCRPRGGPKPTSREWKGGRDW